MKKSEIEIYMDAFMEGFWNCYYTMIDLIDDDDSSETTQESLKESTKAPKQKSESQKAEKSKPNAQKIDRGKVCALLDAGWSAKKIAGEMKVSEASIYNIQKQHREEKAKQSQEGQAKA